MITALLLGGIVAANVQAQENKIEQDRNSIMDMCGCYKVEFRYAEVYAPDTAYTYGKRDYTWAYEWITPVEKKDKKVALQHVLVAGDTVVKHWRQDWYYEGTQAHPYFKDNNWRYAPLSKKSVKGQWTQHVFQVDDSPRYVGSGSWVHVDGKDYWYSEASSPLPRREKKAHRKDYNVLVRGNHHEITDFGWLHRQDNKKILRADNGDDKLIALESGWNTYTKVEQSNCEKAAKYWEQTNPYWAKVRAMWDEKLALGLNFSIQTKIGKQFMYADFFKLALQYQDLSDKELEEKLNGFFTTYVTMKNEQSNNSTKY